MESSFRNSVFLDSLTNLKLVLYTVLEYLDPEDLKNLYTSVAKAGKNNSKNLEGILQAYLYIRLHLNYTDRSYYYAVYCNRHFLQMEKLNIAYLVQSNNKFKQLFNTRQENTKLLTQILTLAGCQQIVNEVLLFSNDPEIPMLKLLRQTVGVGCTSTFSNFLLSLSEDLFSMCLEEYPNLSEFYQKRTNETYIRQFFQIGNLRAQHQDFFKIEKLRFGAYLIKLHENKQLFIENNEMHNLIVVLFYLAEQMVQASAEYLKGIEDPYYRLMEYCLRYSLYRNFVLCIQEKFTFIFQSYSSLYQDYINKSNIDFPQFSFWRPAMSKWYLSMKQFHRQCTKAHNFYLITQRYRNINACLQNMESKDRMQDYTVVRNHIKQLQVEIDEIFGYKSETNKQIYEVIQEELTYCINQYPDYLMDLSIDEVSVHWCGYSKQQVGNPFHEYETITLQSNRKFMEQILKYTQSPSLIQNILDSDLKFLGQNRYYKQKIFSAILNYSELKLKSLCDNSKVHLTYIQQSLDDTIILYNENKKIPKQIEDQQTLSFYQIVPLPEQYLIKYMEKHSMQTLDNTGMSNGEELQYHSDNQMYQIEGQMENEIEQFGLKYEKIENFMEDQSCQQNTEQSKKEEINCKGSQKQDIH